ncbi:MAG: alpha/beta hydrolase domain-containing protein [Eubacteriales bacterium]|nr:alpha/beta hydrolase domain-containing protein [Eubacteriales bacterium]
MISKIEKIAVTKESYPFQAAAERCSLAEHGYAEDEYFMSGTANVYEETDAEHHVRVMHPDAPYTTRLLIRRPVEKEKFSGNIVVEILNASAMMDIDRMWVNTWQYLVRNGDIYIGITSKGHVVDTLKRFDPDRYAPICWDNPLPEREKPSDTGTFPFLPQYESGLFWDMLIELARLLRTEDERNPIREYGPAYLYLLGWSQSGSYMSRILHSFAYRPENRDGAPLFDGYLEAGADASLAPVNAYAITMNDGRIGRDGCVPKHGVLMSREPYIAINTESENRGANWGPDRDLPDWKFRSYQIAGSSHDSKYNLLDYYEGYLYEDAKKYNFELKFGGIEGEPLDTPHQYVFHAALRNLYVWVRDGVPAPHAEPIRTRAIREGESDPLAAIGDLSGKCENEKDAFGNTVGGIRMAALDYPVGRYRSCSVQGEGKIDPMFGTVYPFSPETLQALYGSLAHYRELVTESAKQTEALGFLLREDRDDYIEATVSLAQKRGLR